jgi:hypothetical protein
LLDYASLPGNLDLELRLSRMSNWILQADALGIAYAFKIGATSFPAATGEAHKINCLGALALYQG